MNEYTSMSRHEIKRAMDKNHLLIGRLKEQISAARRNSKMGRYMPNEMFGALERDLREAQLRHQQIQEAYGRTRPQKDDGWKPIETAPREGVSILVFDPSAFGGIFIAKHAIYDRGGMIVEQWRTGLASGHGESSDVHPTHWHPLPEPPK